MFNLDDQKLTQLSMEYDPAPILLALSQQQGQGTNFVTMPGPDGQNSPTYQSILQTGVDASNAQPTQPQQPPKPPFAPLDPVSLRTLMAMQQGGSKAPAPAGLPSRMGPVAIVQPPAPPSLAQLLGGR